MMIFVLLISCLLAGCGAKDNDSRTTKRDPEYAEKELSSHKEQGIGGTKNAEKTDLSEQKISEKNESVNSEFSEQYKNEGSGLLNQSPVSKPPHKPPYREINLPVL